MIVRLGDDTSSLDVPATLQLPVIAGGSSDVIVYAVAGAALAYFLLGSGRRAFDAGKRKLFSKTRRRNARRKR